MPNDYITQIEDTNGVTYDIRDPSKQDLLVSGTNIKTINNESLLGNGDISVSAEPEIFTCVYGTTTFDDALDAYNDGKTLICYDGMGLLLLFSKASNLFKFVRTSETSFVECFLTNSSPYWSTTISSPYATPTASKVAKFDSNAHMNSDDMSAQDVSDFVDGLNIQKVLKTVETKTLLWTNANPTSAFATQTVTFSNPDIYDGFDIQYLGYNSSGQIDIHLTNRMDYDKTFLTYITGSTGTTNGTVYIFKRSVERAATGLQFGSCYSVNGSGNWASYSANTGIVPYKIYGYKIEQL